MTPDPWGINGPDFLKLHAALLVVVFAVGIVLRRAGREAEPTTRKPSPAELALLSGGRARVVLVSLGQPARGQRDRAVERSGLSATAATPAGLSRVDYAVDEAASRGSGRPTSPGIGGWAPSWTRSRPVR